jgi:hypothetical protein
MTSGVRFPEAVPCHLRALELCMQRRWWGEAMALLVSCVDRLTWLWLPRHHTTIEPRLQRAWLARYIVEPGFDVCGLEPLVDLIDRARPGSTGSTGSQARSVPAAVVVFEPASAASVRETLDCAGLHHVALVPFGALASAVARAAVAFVEDARRDNAGWHAMCDRAGNFAEADANLQRFVAAVEAGQGRGNGLGSVRAPGIVGGRRFDPDRRR